MTTYQLSKICEANTDKLHIKDIQIKCTIIIIVQYTKAENVSFVVQFHKNYKEININHSPSQYSL